MPIPQENTMCMVINKIALSYICIYNLLLLLKDKRRYSNNHVYITVTRLLLLCIQQAKNNFILEEYMVQKFLRFDRTYCKLTSIEVKTQRFRSQFVGSFVATTDLTLRLI